MARHLSHHLGQLGVDPTQGPPLTDVVLAQRERAKTLTEMAQGSAFFYRDVGRYEPKDAAAHLKPEAAAPLSDLRDRLSALPLWTAEAIHEVLAQVAEGRGLKLGKIAQPLRVAIAGRAVSPPIDQTLALVGRERSLQRIDRALARIIQI